MLDDVTPLLVREILEHATEHGPWLLRGYGQLMRLHLTPDGGTCLHVFLPRDTAPREMHTHLYPLRSRIVSGSVEQVRYERGPSPGSDADATYRWMETPQSPPADIRLFARPLERFLPGDEYEQASDEIHHTMPEAGTVTLLRWGLRDDPPPVQVFWPVDREHERPWTPRFFRDATPVEVERFASVALARWDDPPLRPYRPTRDLASPA